VRPVPPWSGKSHHAIQSGSDFALMHNTALMPRASTLGRSGKCSLIFLGYWCPRLGILGALGSIVTFIGTTSIIPFLPDGWAHEAGGFPIMTLPLGFGSE